MKRIEQTVVYYLLKEPKISHIYEACKRIPRPNKEILSALDRLESVYAVKINKETGELELGIEKLKSIADDEIRKKRFSSRQKPFQEERFMKSESLGKLIKLTKTDLKFLLKRSGEHD